MNNSTMKIKRHLPCAPFPPTRAVYKKPVIGEGKYIKVLPSEYRPKPAPIPKRTPKPKPKKKLARGYKREVHQQSRFWTDDKIEMVIEMYEAGKTLQEIGNVYGKPGTSVRNLITRLSDKGLIERHHAEHYTDEDIERIRELKTAGKTYAEIGDIMGRTPSAVFNVLKRADGGKK